MSAIINGRYLLHNKIGSGGMGVVFRSTDRLTGDIVALKQVHLSGHLSISDSLAPNATQDDLRLALAHEFRILAGLRHPHIISVLDYGFDEARQPFFTMTYLPESQDLMEAAKDASLERKIELIQQLLQALAYLHRRGVLHRDLKPDNVLVADGVVRVLDFGLSSSNKTTGSESVGTPLYMAPELFEGEPYSQSADLFAVGVLLYQLLTGVHPFAPFDHAFLDRVLDEEPDLEEVDERLWPLLRQFLAKRPSDRFASTSSALAALTTALGQPQPEETVAIRESYLQAATFVGRKTEIATLTDALQKAADGNGSAWLIGGESGVGKSRLINELQTTALVAGFQLLRGQSAPDGSGVSYQLWREPLRQLIVSLPEVDDLAAGVLLPLVPDIEQLLGKKVEPAIELEDKDAQSRLLTTIAQLFAQAERPLLLILEDLHWASESFLQLPYLTRTINRNQLLLIGTYRSDEQPDLPDQLTDVQPMPLPRLTETEMAELSEAMLGQVGRQQAIVDLIQRETEGNAFFTVEVVRELAMNVGRLENIGQTPLPERLFPDGIQTVIDRRLNRLPAVSTPLLQLAAVAGRDLDLSLLEQLAADILAADIDVQSWWLSVCAEAAVLDVVDNQWRFSHDKIRERIYQAMTPEIRADSHAKIARSYEVVYPKLSEVAATIAQHWQDANQPEEELTYRLTAAHYAQSQFAMEDALNHFSRAYQLTPEENKYVRFDILDNQVKLLNSLGWKEQEGEALTELTVLAEEMGESEKIIAATLRQIELQISLGNYEASAENAERIVARFEGQLEPKLIEIYPRWAWCYQQLGKNLEALALLDRAMPLLQGSNTQDEVQAQLTRASVESNVSQMDAAIASQKEALALARKLNFPLHEIRALNNLAGSYFKTKELIQAIDYFEQAFELNQHIGHQPLQLFLLTNLGVCQFMRHDYSVSTTYLEKALVLAQAVGNQFMISSVAGNMGENAYLLGQFKEGLQHAQYALTILEEIATTHAYYNGSVWRIIAQCHFYLEQWDEAKAAFQTALVYCEEHGLSGATEEIHAGLARTALFIGNLQQAEEHSQPVLTFLENESEPSYDYLFFYLACYEVLRHDSSADAEAYLVEAYRLVESEDAKITNEESRQLFWEEHVIHREVARLYEAL